MVTHRLDRSALFPTLACHVPISFRMVPLSPVLHLMTSYSPLRLVCLLALGTSATAQVGLPMRAPIHSAPADAEGLAYGLWASGSAFKASFHDGFAFHPVVGASRASATVQWRTLGVHRASEALVGIASVAAPVHTDWRCEYHHALVTEAYDVREEGVEQTFVLATPLPGSGDLIVAGELSSRLTASLHPRTDGAAAILLSDTDGEALVRYGEARVFDAAGRHSVAATRLSGTRVELVVPAAFVDGATWPVTVDPLLSMVALSSTGPTPETDIASALDSGALGVIVASVRTVSATDADVYVHLTNRDFANPQLVFSDITSSWSTPHARTGFVRGATTSGRWVIALERDFPAQVYSRIRVVFHDYGNTTLNSGTVVAMSAPSGSTHRDPDIASAYGGTRTLVVWQSDVTANQSNTLTTEVEYATVDARSMTFGTPDIVSNSPSGTVADREHVRLTQIPDDTGDLTFVAVWQVKTLLSSWRVYGQRLSLVSGKGTATLLTQVISGVSGIDIRPEVGGSDGRFGVFSLRVAANADVAGTHIVGTRFNWPTAAATPTLGVAAVVAVDPTPILGPPGMACDVTTNSHWVGAYMRGTRRVDFVKVGYDMRRTEAGIVNSEAVATMAGPSVCLDTGGRFLMSWGMLTSGSGVRCRGLGYPAASSVVFGTGCGGTIADGWVPLFGSEQWPVVLTNADANVPAVLSIGFANAAIPLAFLGMGPCMLNLSPTGMITVPTSTSGTGVAVLLLPLPGIGELFTQWTFFRPGANALGLVTTQGMQSSVR